MKYYHNRHTGQRFSSEYEYYKAEKFRKLKAEWYEGGAYYEDEKDPTPTLPSIEENSTEVKEHFDNELFEAD